MKKFLLILIFFGLVKIVNGQASQANNIAPNTQGPYIGWQSGGGSGAIDLEIKTEQSKNINFYTNAGAGTFNNQRMIIKSNGAVGIGQNFTTPGARLDIPSPPCLCT